MSHVTMTVRTRTPMKPSFRTLFSRFFFSPNFLKTELRWGGVVAHRSWLLAPFLVPPSCTLLLLLGASDAPG